MNHLTWLAAIAATLAAPAIAGERIELSDKAPVVIDPGKAYVTYSGATKFPLMLIRAVTADELGKWQGLRAQALAKAQAKYARTKKDYDQNLASWTKMDPTERAIQEMPEAPIPISNDSFSFPPAEMDNFVYARARPYSRDANGYRFVIAIPPGHYTIYGPHDAFTSGTFGIACLCMGSVAFDASAGKVVNLGQFTNKYGETPVFTLEPAKPGDVVPLALSAVGVSPARFSAAGKMPNYHGTLIERLPPIPGVLAYRRDIAVDVASGQDAPSFR